MSRTARALRKRAEKAALREMRTTELRTISNRARAATIGDVQDAVEWALREYDAHRKARTLRGRVVATWQRWRCRREVVRLQRGRIAAQDATAETEDACH